jgi:peptide-methionine (S)-S-oxide reductase
MRDYLTKITLVVVTFLSSSCQTSEQRGQDLTPAEASTVETKNLAVATFAGGCFWCMEPPFDKLTGVISTTSGYIGGHKSNPSYEEVSSGWTGHAEAVQVAYDSTRISYIDLLEVFWRNIDPLATNRQFCDAGSQYRSAIFYHNDEQRRLAEASKQKLEQAGRFDRPIVTEIVPATEFYPAEEYHQDFYKKNPIRYKAYRTGCGRDRRLKELWGESH